ncbi:Rne/Rng family ribonuclease [Brevibacterium salitolerans]|uniref:S1 motif domain-containing protein n=1 Tax=Brevibacterium salitolerans TaxID=1403566 RepID=A0ABN2WCF4_9MICO
MSTSDDGRLDPTAGILADLESLRASRRQAEEGTGADSRPEAKALLDDIAEAAAHLRDDSPQAPAEPEAQPAERPAPKSARASVANRGLVFESYIADTHDADEDDSAEEEPGTEETAPAPAVSVSNPFSHFADSGTGVFTPVAAPAGGGLLFQPPQEDLAQPVEPEWFDDEDDDYDDEEPAEDGGDGSEDESAGDDERSGDDEDRGRSRRRRGGRGRRSRGRGRDAEAGDDETTNGGRRSGESQDPGDSDGRDEAADEDSGEDGDRRGRGRGRRRRGGDAKGGADAKGGESGDGGAAQDGKDDRRQDRKGGESADREADGGGNRSGEAAGSAGGDRSARSEGGDASAEADSGEDADDEGSRRRRRRRARGSRKESGSSEDEVTGVKGSTRLEAKRQRRREGREAGRRRPLLTEAEFLARRESVTRTMLVRETAGRTQLVVLEDGIAVEHYLSEHKAQASLIGNVYLGKVQNVLPSMEAAFIDIGKGRNAVLYAGEVNWDALGMNGKPHRIEQALSSGDPVLVQVTKDPVGHKGARLTSQISLPGRFLVYIPGNSMTGISRKLPDNERARLKKLLKEILPADAGVIVRTASEGASDEELRRDVERLSKRWESISKKSTAPKTGAPKLLYSEPDMIVRIIRDVFNEDFDSLVIDGDGAWDTIHEYVEAVAPDLLERVSRYGAPGTETESPAAEGTDIFDHFRVSEQIEKALNRKVNLPSGGSLVIDRTEAMTVIDVNTGKFTGSGGNLEETVTKNNLEAAEEVIRQLRLRDIGGIIVVDFIDMVLEANRDLVTRRLVECLSRDRTRHQVAEVTSLGLVQMTRKRIGTGLAESLVAAGEDLSGRGLLLPGTEPGEAQGGGRSEKGDRQERRSRKKGRGQNAEQGGSQQETPEADERTEQSRNAVAAIAKATLKQEEKPGDPEDGRADGDVKSGGKGSSAAEPAADGQGAAADAQDGATPRKRSRSRRSRGRRDSTALPEAAGSGGEAGQVQETKPAEAAEQEPAAEKAAQEPAPLPEPSGPAPLMIGADATTSVQRAPRKKAPAKKAPAVKEAPAPVEEKEQAPKAPATPILLFGMED